MNTEYLAERDLAVEGDNYNFIYGGRLPEGESLDGIYERFNLRHPEGYEGHSLSVSDMVVMQRDGEARAYYVDSFGFSEIDEFVEQRQRITQKQHRIEDAYINADSLGIIVDGHEGTWRTIEGKEIGGEMFYLMESQEYGDEAANILLHMDGDLVAEDLWNGIDYGAMQAVREYFDDHGMEYSLIDFPLQERYSIEPVVDESEPAGFVIKDHVTGQYVTENGVAHIYDDRMELLEQVRSMNQNVQGIYRESAAYAREHGQIDAYRFSRQENNACKDGIEQVIRDNFDGMHLNPGVIKPVINRFGAERTAYVLANTVQNAEWDQRYSRSNKEWAASVISGAVDEDRRTSFLINSHPAVLDGFVDMFRKELTALGLEQDGTRQVEKPFIDHFYVVDDLEVKGPLAIKKYDTLDAALEAYFGLPNDKLKALGIQNTNPLPGSLDFIQCENGIDTATMDYTSVEVWNNPEIQALQTDIDMALALHDTEIAYEMEDGFFLIQNAADGFDYSFYDKDYHLIDGGLLEDPLPGDLARTIKDAANDILSERDQSLDDCRVVNYEEFCERVEQSQESIITESIESNAVSEEMKLAEEIDQFVYDYDYYEYMDSYDSREEAFEQLQELFREKQVLGIKDWLKEVIEDSDDPESVSMAQGFLDRLEALFPEKEATLTYYVAECMEFPVLGEYHEVDTLAEAVKLYEQIPADRMNGIKGIGFNLHDGSDYAGAYPLMQGGKVVTEMIDLVEHYKNSPLVQQAVEDIKQYYPDVRETEYQPREAEENAPAVTQTSVEAAPAEKTEASVKPPEKVSDAPEKKGNEVTSGRRESVLKALRDRQAQIKEREKNTPEQKNHDRKKGEQSL